MFFFSLAIGVDDCCLDVVSDYVVIGYVKLVCEFCFAVLVSELCLNLMLGDVLIGYVKLVFVVVLPLVLTICV